MSPSLKKLAPVVVILAGSLGLGGCATKGFVREQVAVVDFDIDRDACAHDCGDVCTQRTFIEVGEVHAVLEDSQ